MQTKTMQLSTTSNKGIFKRLFKNAKAELASAEEPPRRKVSKSQIKLLYVDTSKREAADLMEWRRPERRAVNKDQITLIGVDCRRRVAADAGVELLDDEETSDDETVVGDDSSICSIKREGESKVLSDDDEFAEADCSIPSVYSTESMWSFSSECSTDSEFVW